MPKTSEDLSKVWWEYFRNWLFVILSLLWTDGQLIYLFCLSNKKIAHSTFKIPQSNLSGGLVGGLEARRPSSSLHRGMELGTEAEVGGDNQESFTRKQKEMRRREARWIGECPPQTYYHLNFAFLWFLSLSHDFETFAPLPLLRPTLSLLSLSLSLSQADGKGKMWSEL